MGYVGFSQFRGRWSKRGRDIFKIQGELAKRESLKNQGGEVWTLDEAMVIVLNIEYF